MNDDAEPERTNGGDLQVYKPEWDVNLTETFSQSADTMEEFNRFLWQFARTVFIIAAMLLAVSSVVVLYFLAEFLATM